jgi:hypothetical protein
MRTDLAPSASLGEGQPSATSFLRLTARGERGWVEGMKVGDKQLAVDLYILSKD